VRNRLRTYADPEFNTMKNLEERSSRDGDAEERLIGQLCGTIS